MQFLTQFVGQFTILSVIVWKHITDVKSIRKEVFEID
nr:MAG TPA: hypothetical protein [Caudoviricetes sp.]